MDQAKTFYGPSVMEDMSDYHIWCFTCKTKAQKKTLKAQHLDHEVDYVRNSDGERYSKLPGNPVPHKLKGSWVY